MTKSSMTTAPFVAYVGIDWADKVHAVCELSQDGSCIHATEVDQSPEAIAQWLKRLRAICGQGAIAVGLELSRGGLVAALLQYEGLVLFPVNPRQFSRYRDAMVPSGAKNDPGDAKLLAEFVRDHHSRLRPWTPDDAETRTISLCCELRRKLVEEKKRLIQRMRSLLKTYYPLALEIVGESLATKLAQDFLVRWPSLAQTRRAHPTHLIKFFEEHNCRRKELNKRRVGLIRSASPLTTDPAIIGPSSLMVSVLAKQLRELERAIGEFDGRIAQLMATHTAAPVFRSLPGAGDALAPRLLAAMGSDLERYTNAAQLQSYSGIAPVTKQSGRTRTVQRRRACPHFIKQSFHEFADHARLYSDWSRAYYRLLRARGERHHAAVRALAFKWIRIIYRLWQTGEVYDEAVYIRRLAERHSPVVKFLPSG